MDDAPIPHELARALTYKTWGVGDVFNLPAGLVRKMNVAINTYNALQSSVNAARQTKVTQFAKTNPDAWDLYTRIISARKRGWDGNSDE